jgi:uncharacterized repeat protein (TIGR03843 family)
VIQKPLSAANKLKQTLEKGEISLQGQFLLGSNYTFLVTVHHDGQEFPAVYKPTRGEQPLWDFPEASLARREVAAYLVSEALGFGLVPLTVLRDGPLGPGSLQQFIEYNPNYHYFNFKPADRQLLRPVVLFDLLINNADRKGSHVFFAPAVSSALITACASTQTTNCGPCSGTLPGKPSRPTCSLR